MDQEQLEDFLAARELEKKMCFMTIAYIQQLKEQALIKPEAFDLIMIDLNNRFVFLEKSIKDHKKHIN